MSFRALITHAVDFHQDLVRNIRGIRSSQNLFDDIADEAALAVAMAAEELTRIPTRSPLITRPFDYGTLLTYPFLPENWQQTRFSEGTQFGVWYGCLKLDTTVYETAYHWHRFVTDSYSQEDRLIRADRRVFKAKCDGILIDLRGKEVAHPQLLDRKSYRYAQSVGHYLHDQQQNGVLVKSARSDGINAAILRQAALSDPRDVCFLTYQLNPTEDKLTVERQLGKKWLSIQPSSLY